MVVKIYISGISGNKEVKKRQQRVAMILDSRHIAYELIDITEPGREDDKEFMQQNSRALEGAKYALPPQIFKEDEYCGDYDQFDLSNENDELEAFLKLTDDEIHALKTTSTSRVSPAKDAAVPVVANGISSREVAEPVVDEHSEEPKAEEVEAANLERGTAGEKEAEDEVEEEEEEEEDD